MPKLIKAVYVRDPERHRTVVLLPGEEPAPHLAALVTNPDAWEDGVLPDTAGDGDDGSTAQEPAKTEGDTKQAAPAAKKTAAKKAATTPARGRSAADEGNSGD